MRKLIVILAALALVVAFIAPAMAADWNFYGSARFATFRVSDEYTGTDDVDNTQWDQQGNSRIGANVKFNDEIGGRFEMSDSFGKRLLYGTYNFGSGQLLIGQAYVPTTQFYSNSVYDGDGDLLGVGQFYIGRQPMIQLKMGGLKLAFIKPNAMALAGSTCEVTLPKMEVSYGFKSDAFFADVFGGYQTYEVKMGTVTEDIDSYVVGLGAGVNMGPVFVKANVHMSQNQGQYGAYNPAGMADEAVYSGGKLVDNDGLGYLAVVGFKASDSLTFEIGYGHEENELDVEGAKSDETSQYYGNCTIVITPGFFVVPEVGLIDREDDADAVDTDETFYFGMKWQINF